MKTRPTLFNSFRFLFFLIALLISCNLQAQTPTVSWAKAVGSVNNEAGMGVAFDAAGNSYYTGFFAATADFDPGPGTYNLSPVAVNDVFILKLDAAGNFAWARAVGGANQDAGMRVKVDAAGNVYVVGYYQGTVDFDPGPGTFNLTSAGSDDVFLLKLDASGSFVYALGCGGASADQPWDFTIDGGNVYITGIFTGTADFDPGPGTATLTGAGAGPDVYVLKLDLNGNYIWAGRMGGTGSDNGAVINTDASGNIYITGQFRGTADFDPGAGTYNLTAPAANADVYFVKLDASGNFLWAGKIAGSLVEVSSALQIDASGNVYVGGRYPGTVDFDPGAGTYNLTAAGSDDAFLLKLDASGNFVAVYPIGGTGGERLVGAALDASGNIYAIGTFSNTCDFDPGPGTANLTSVGSAADVFFVKLDASGNYVWSSREGTAGSEILNNGIMDASGNFYCIGVFSGTAGVGGYNFTAAGINDVLVFKMSNPSALPLRLLDFNVMPGNGSVQINWTASNEENVSHFNVERSADGVNFLPVVRIAAKNNSSTEYNYSDPASFNHTLYYRLKITDLDDGHSYSPVRMVKAAGRGAPVQLGPVPAKNTLTISTVGLASATGRISIQVFSSVGRLVKTGSMQAGNVLTLDISALNSGTYIVRLSGTRNYQSTHKFLKQ